MAGRPICLLVFLMPSPRLELRTLAGYNVTAIYSHHQAEQNCKQEEL